MEIWDVLSSLEVKLGLVFLAGAFAGGYATASGGGKGLLTVPFISILGFNPVMAIAASKLSSLLWSIVSTFRFAKEGAIHWRAVLVLTIFGGGFTWLGAHALTQVPTEVIYLVMGILIVLVALVQFVFFLRKENWLERLLERLEFERQPSWMKLGWLAVLAPYFGFYGGFYGSGNGIMISAFLQWIYRQRFSLTVGTAIAFSVVTDLVATTKLTLAGFLDWKLFLALAMGEILGGWFGSGWFVKRERLARKVMLLVALVLSVKLLFF